MCASLRPFQNCLQIVSRLKLLRLRVTSEYQSFHYIFSTLQLERVMQNTSRILDTRMMLHLAALNCIPHLTPQDSSTFRSLCSST